MASHVSDLDKRNEPPVEEERKLSEPPPTVSSRKLRIMLIGVLLVAIVVAAWFYFSTRNRVSTDDAQVDGHIVPIAAKVSGNIAAVLVDDNQPVKAGDVLVRIDPRDYQARVDQARAALSVAESQARGAQVTVPLTNATTETGMSSAEAQVATAQAELTRARVDAAQAAEADLSYAQANVESAQANYDRARADPAAGAAQARLEKARADLSQSRANRKQVDISAAQASSARASVQHARANLETADLELSYTTVKAPVDGVVTRKTVQLGQIVQPGQAFLILVPLKDVWVTANFKETQLSGVIVGQRAEVKVDMYGKSFPARVDSLSGATGTRLSLLPPENATGNYVKVVQRVPVKITFDPLPDKYVLRPGMNVEATIFTK